jgi:hypothetical protein
VLRSALAALPSAGHCNVAQLRPTVWRVTFLEVTGDVTLLTSASLLWTIVTVSVTPVEQGYWQRGSQLRRRAASDFTDHSN